MKRKNPKKAAELMAKVEELDKQIGQLQGERDRHTQALAEHIAEYHPGDVLQKKGSRAGLWLVEGIGPGRWTLYKYCLRVRKLKKDGTPSKVTAGFDSGWDLDQCSLVSRPPDPQ